jgi:Protein of unknown function (DUF3102)
VTAVSSDLITTETTLAQHAEEIRSLGKRTIANVIEIGRRLTESKKLCGHGNWLPWLEREFGWDERTARRYISTYEFAGKSDKLSDLEIGVSSLYMLAAPSTPEEVRTGIIERVAAGEKVAVADVREAKETSRGSVAEVNAKVKTKADRAKKPPKKPKADVSAAADRADPSISLPKFISQFTRTDGQVKAACDFNPEDPGDVAESPNDTPEIIRHRIFMYRATEALRLAREFGFEQASSEEITDDIIDAVVKAAEAWSELAWKLRQEIAPGSPVRQNPPDGPKVPGADGPP